MKDIAARMNDLSSFNIKAAPLNDVKSQKLYKQLNPDYNIPGNGGEESKRPAKGKKRAAANNKPPSQQRKRRNEMILRLKSVPKSFKCSIARSAPDFKTKTPLMSLKKLLKTLS